MLKSWNRIFKSWAGYSLFSFFWASNIYVRRTAIFIVNSVHVYSFSSNMPSTLAKVLSGSKVCPFLDVKYYLYKWQFECTWFYSSNDRVVGGWLCSTCCVSGEIFLSTLMLSGAEKGSPAEACLVPCTSCVAHCCSGRGWSAAARPGPRGSRSGPDFIHD